MITLKEFTKQGMINKIKWIKGNITFFTKTMPDKKMVKKYKIMLKEYEKELRREY